jgi:hypothetical protein
LLLELAGFYANIFEQQSKELRFRVGSVVECRTGPGWVRGRVVRLWYFPRDPSRLFAFDQRHADDDESESINPYQVRLDSGDLITASGIF